MVCGKCNCKDIKHSWDCAHPCATWRAYRDAEVTAGRMYTKQLEIARAKEKARGWENR